MIPQVPVVPGSTTSDGCAAGEHTLAVMSRTKMRTRIVMSSQGQPMMMLEPYLLYSFGLCLDCKLTFYAPDGGF